MSTKMEPGRYAATLSEELVLAEGGDKAYLSVKATISLVLVNGDWVPLPNPEERELRWFVTDKTMGPGNITERRLMKFGFNWDWDNPRLSGEVLNSVELECTHNEGGYERWDLPAGAREVKAADRAKVMELKAMYRKPAGIKPPIAPPARI